jgi:hypothetical protein
VHAVRWRSGRVASKSAPAVRRSGGSGRGPVCRSRRTKRHRRDVQATRGIRRRHARDVLGSVRRDAEQRAARRAQRRGAANDRGSAGLSNPLRARLSNVPWVVEIQLAELDSKRCAISAQSVLLVSRAGEPPRAHGALGTRAPVDGRPGCDPAQRPRCGRSRDLRCRCHIHRGALSHFVGPTAREIDSAKIVRNVRTVGPRGAPACAVSCVSWEVGVSTLHLTHEHRRVASRCVGKWKVEGLDACSSRSAQKRPFPITPAAVPIGGVGRGRCDGRCQTAVRW